MTDEQQHAGGVAWEAREALIAVRRARAANDADAEDLAWLRYAEALMNASQAGAAGAFIGLLTQREDAYLARMDEAERQRRNDAKTILDVLGELRGGQTALQAGFLAVGESVTQLQAEVAYVSAELGRSREHRAQLQAGQDALFKAILPIEERDRLIALLLDAERRLGIVEAEIAGLKAMQRQLDPGAPL